MLPSPVLQAMRVRPLMVDAWVAAQQLLIAPAHNRRPVIATPRQASLLSQQLTHIMTPRVSLVWHNPGGKNDNHAKQHTMDFSGRLHK